MLVKDPHFRDITANPGRDNGFDIEGLAVNGPRFLLRSPGPVRSATAVGSIGNRSQSPWRLFAPHAARRLRMSSSEALPAARSKLPRYRMTEVPISPRPRAICQRLSQSVIPTGWCRMALRARKSGRVDRGVRPSKARHACGLAKRQSARAKEADQADKDQVYSHDEVEQLGHDQNQHACYQRNQRGQAQMNIHDSGGYCLRRLGLNHTPKCNARARQKSVSRRKICYRFRK